MKKITVFIVIPIIILLVVSTTDMQARVKKTKSADGVEISFQVKGKGKTALLFIHGWCCDKTYWKKQIPAFSKKYRVITIDLAGHGDSGMNRKKWTMKTFGQDVVAVVNRLKLKKVILIGHSMGGTVMVEATRQIPRRVIGLIGVDTLANVEQKFTREQFEFFTAPVRKNFKKGTENFLRGMFFSPKTDKTLIEEIVADMCNCPPKVGLGAWESMFSYDLPAAMDEIKAHIRCINSDKYPQNKEAGKRHSASYEVTLMRGLGHFIMMEDPGTFNILLEKTIQELIRE